MAETVMAETVVAEATARPLAIRAALAGVILRMRARRPRLRRQQEAARLALTELEIRRLDERIDALIGMLAQVCDYSGQPDVACQFRALGSQPEPAEVPMLRLVRQP